MAEQTPDSIITTQKNGQTIVAELFFNHSGTETIPRQAAQSDTCRQLCRTVKSRKNRKFCDNSRPGRYIPRPGGFYRQKRRFLPKSRAGKNTRKMPLLRNRGAERRVYANRASQAKKTTDIWFDEKDPLIHIRTHNTDLKKRLAAYAEQHPDVCRQTDADPETGCMEFDIEKGRFSFRLTAPYSEERRGRRRGGTPERATPPTG